MNESEFYNLLIEVKASIELRYPHKEMKKISDTEFEQICADEIEKRLPSSIKLTYQKKSTAFPDIGCPPYGVEIKTTEGKSWVCFGNSIMEGTRRDRVDIIYVIFLKKGGDTPEIRIKKYEDCISDIKITHSPRYEINMDLDVDDTIFHKMNSNYHDFNQDEQKIKKLRQYYRSKNAQSWWLDEDSGETTASFELQSYGGLPKTEKQKLMSELFALFPETLNSKYESASAYLISKYSICDKSFRDKFSAGTREATEITGDIEILSQIVIMLISSLPNIIDFIEQNPTLISEEWGIPSNNLIDIWFDKAQEQLSQNSSVKSSRKPLKDIYSHLYSS